MGGGALLDVGCYGVSAVRWLLGQEPVQVQAAAEIGPSGVDLNTAAILTFEAGALAVIEASFKAGLQQTYSIAGSRGVIELPHNAFIPWEADAVYYQRGVDDEVPAVETVPGADEYQLMVEHFSGAVQGPHPLAFDPQDSIDNMAVLDAVAESFRSNSPVPVTREAF
jgi:predicted dehydrogenase